MLFLLGVAFEKQALRWWEKKVARRRAARALRGERRAESLLTRLGYEVLERQPHRSFELHVDGQPQEIRLRPDYIVRRKGRVLVAEVKTGQHAPRIESQATRRQLLEYRVACVEADGVLLVDVDGGLVQEIQFPLLRYTRRNRVHFLSVVFGMGVGAVVVWCLLRLGGIIEI